MVLALSITLPLIIIICFFVTFFIYGRFKNAEEVQDKGTLLAKIDLTSRKIIAYDSQTNSTVPHIFFNKAQLGQWIPIEELLQKYKGGPFEKLIRSMMVEIKDAKEFVKGEFTTTKRKKRTKVFDILITMYKFEESTDIGMTTEWTKKSEFSQELPFVKYSDKQTIADISEQYKGFVSLQLNNNIPNISKEMSIILYKIFKSKKYYFFSSNGVITIVLARKKATKAKKEVQKIIAKINYKGARLGIHRLFRGSSMAIVKDVNTPKRINNMLELINFNINLSLRSDKPFITSDDEDFNVDEYKAISEGTKIFKQAVKVKDIKPSDILVKNEYTNKKIMIYSYPRIEGITNEVQSIILKDQSNKEALTDKFAEMIAIDNVLKVPVLVDINNEWLSINYKKMKYKEAIYIINYNPYKWAKTDKIIRAMKAKKFTFAIRISRFNEGMITRIKKLKPQFIVVDKELSNVKDPEKYIQLLSIKNTADIENIKIIYENPSSKVDTATKKVLGIKYAYKF